MLNRGEVRHIAETSGPCPFEKFRIEQILASVRTNDRDPDPLASTCWIMTLHSTQHEPDSNQSRSTAPSNYASPHLECRLRCGSPNKSLEMRWMKAMAENTKANVVDIEDDGTTRFHKPDAAGPMFVGPI